MLDSWNTILLICFVLDDWLVTLPLQIGMVLSWRVVCFLCVWSNCNCCLPYIINRGFPLLVVFRSIVRVCLIIWILSDVQRLLFPQGSKGKMMLDFLMNYWLLLFIVGYLPLWRMMWVWFKRKRYFPFVFEVFKVSISTVWWFFHCFSVDLMLIDGLQSVLYSPLMASCGSLFGYFSCPVLSVRLDCLLIWNDGGLSAVGAVLPELIWSSFGWKFIFFNLNCYLDLYAIADP